MLGIIKRKVFAGAVGVPLTVRFCCFFSCTYSLVLLFGMSVHYNPGTILQTIRPALSLLRTYSSAGKEVMLCCFHSILYMFHRCDFFIKEGEPITALLPFPL